MNRAYYAIIPADVRYDADLTPNAKLLYGELTALCNEKGYCWASNAYFAGLYNTTTRSVSKGVSQLIEKGYIDSQVILDGKKVKERRITITPRRNVPDPIEENFHTPQKKCSKGILQSNNTVNKNKGSRFTPPTLDEVTRYCSIRENQVDAESFINFYESNGWNVGKNKMRDWKAAVRTWERRDSVAKQRHSGGKKDAFERLQDVSWAGGLVSESSD